MGIFEDGYSNYKLTAISCSKDSYMYQIQSARLHSGSMRFTSEQWRPKFCGSQQDTPTRAPMNQLFFNKI